MTSKPPIHTPARRLRVLTWPVHGNYLLYLAQCGHEIVLPIGGEDGYEPLSSGFDWPENIVQVPVDRVQNEQLDVVLFQAARNWERDQFTTLSAEQRALPRIYIEHDPPREHPTDTRHRVDDPDVLLVHVTHFNALIWDSGATRTVVVEHGVTVPDGIRWTGEIRRGIVVINGLDWRGRRLGRDIFETLRRDVPLDLVGIGSQALGGLGPVTPRDLAAFVARYRFFFHPARYTSLSLAVLEAMTIGMPIVGLATTELPTVLRDGDSALLSNDLTVLRHRMFSLLDDEALAAKLGEAARAVAESRFNIRRYAADWDRLLTETAARR